MKIQQISQPAFQAKTRFLSPKQLKGVKNLLTRMNSETVTRTDGMGFCSTVTNKISIKKNSFTDTRMFFDKIPADQQMTKDSMFAFGDKVLVVINNKTGQITDWRKPFFKSWGCILKKIDKYITLFNKHYDDNTIVKKSRHSIIGFTSRGASEIEKAQRNLNG